MTAATRPGRSAQRTSRRPMSFTGSGAPQRNSPPLFTACRLPELGDVDDLRDEVLHLAVGPPDTAHGQIAPDPLAVRMHILLDAAIGSRPTPRMSATRWSSSGTISGAVKSCQVMLSRVSMS